MVRAANKLENIPGWEFLHSMHSKCALDVAKRLLSLTQKRGSNPIN